MMMRTRKSPPQPLSDLNLGTLIHAEQISMLYRQLPTSVAGNMAGALMLAGVMLGEQPLWLITGWLAAVTLFQGWRLTLYFMSRKTGFVQKNVGRASALWAAGAGISGMLWGTTALLFYISGHYLYQAVLTILVFGVTAAAVPLIGSHIPSFYVFVLPTLLPFIVRNAYEGDAPHYVLSVIALAVMMGLLSFARNYNRMLVESLRNRFEKQMLADRLSAQNVDLEQARVAAEQANRSKTQFFAAASHDLRQPLHAMGLFAAALAGKVHDPEVLKLVGSINSSVQALEALFNELLDISKLDSGIIKPVLRDFAIDSIFDNLRSEFAAEAAAKSLGFRIAPSNAVVRSDPVLLERILRNLLANAIRYTATGKIAVVATAGKSSLHIEVCDTGVGIRADDQQRIFEEFLQLGNPGRTSKKGMGLGLSIVRRLADLLGYRISVESEYGRGSTFAIDVPLGAAASVKPAAPAAVQGHTDLTGRLVVIVDDEEAIVEGMRLLLGGWGAQVVGSVTGDDIIARVHEIGQLPDLFLVDYRLGTAETGIELVQRLRQELDPEIPAILVTGSITPELDAQARAAGLEFLLKPVTATALRERMAALLRINLA